MSIYEYLNEFSEISFHMPGHKGQIHVPIKDVTELSGTDNLRNPQGIIKEAQEQMAKALEKREAFFLTNGASSGILASILSSTQENETVLIDRNCHISVQNGLILSGAVPKYIYPKMNRDFQIPSPISADDFTYQGEKTVIVTSPTYYGEVSDIASIRQKVGDATLIQDESHGAHFYFCDRLKPYRNKLSDLTVLSFHKTMPTLNQGAILARNTEKISSVRVKESINLVTTTSPSYPIMASLDYAGKYGAKHYNQDEILEKVFALKNRLRRETPLRILDNQDCYKLFVNCDDCNQSAIDIQRILEQKYSIYVEGVFGNNLLLMFSPYNREEEVNLLEKALLSLELTTAGPKEKNAVPVLLLPQRLSPREAFYAPGEVVPLKKAVGRVSKESITRFPPCVPLVMMGEEITPEAIPYIEKEFVEVVK